MGTTHAKLKCKVGDTEVTMSPLTVRQVEEIDHWMQVRFLRAIKEAADGDETMLAVGMQEVLTLSYFSSKGVRFLSNLHGMAKVFSMTADLDFMDAAKILESADAITDFNENFKALNNPDPIDASKNAENNQISNSS